MSELYDKPIWVIENFSIAYECSAVDPLQPAHAVSAKDLDLEEQRRWFTALLRAFSEVNMSRSSPLIEAYYPAIYRLSPWIRGLPPSEKLAPPQLNLETGRRDIVNLLHAFFADEPL